MIHDTGWYLDQYHQVFGALVYDGNTDGKPIDPYVFSVPGFDDELIEQLYCDEILKVLTKRQREFIVMKYDGYSTDDIAKEYHCRQTNVRNAIYKARKRLANTSINNG